MIYLNNFIVVQQTLKFAFNTKAAVIHEMLYKIDFKGIIFFVIKEASHPFLENQVHLHKWQMFSVLEMRLSHVPSCPDVEQTQCRSLTLDSYLCEVVHGLLYYLFYFREYHLFNVKHFFFTNCWLWINMAHSITECSP